MTQDEVFSSLLIDRGWAAVLPMPCVALIAAVIESPGITPKMLEQGLCDSGGEGLGLERSAWDPVEQWTAQHLREIGVRLPLVVANHLEIVLRVHRVRNLDRYFEATGVDDPHTLRGVLRFLLAAGVVDERHGGLHINPQAPTASQVFGQSR